MPRILSEAALNKKVLKQLGDLQLGDLVEVTWLDASRGSWKPLRSFVSLERKSICQFQAATLYFGWTTTRVVAAFLS